MKIVMPLCAVSDMYATHTIKSSWTVTKLFNILLFQKCTDISRKSFCVSILKGQLFEIQNIYPTASDTKNMPTSSMKGKKSQLFHYIQVKTGNMSSIQ